MGAVLSIAASSPSKVLKEASTNQEDPNPNAADPAGGDDTGSVATSDMSVSSLGSDDIAEISGGGGFGLRGIHGRHGEPQRQAIELILPVLREQLETEGALALSEKQNVQIALDIASNLGFGCWGPGKVYKSKRNVENAILNLYFQSVVASLHS